MREKYIENLFVRSCEQKGFKVIKMIPTYETGIPDRQVLFNGVSGFAEIKAPGKKPKLIQAIYLDNLKKAGFFSGVVDSPQAIQHWITDFENHVINLTQPLPYCPICGKQNKKP